MRRWFETIGQAALRPLGLGRPSFKRATRYDRSISARFLPYRPKDRVWAVCWEPLDMAREADLPLPPRDCRENYGLRASRPDEQYLADGQGDVTTILRLVEQSGLGLSACHRVLDFGCATGRLIRWFRAFAADHEAWGTDLNASHILWCQQHLSPPFRFVTTTSFPHLPFDDGYFDLVYAVSVFTHIADLADAWLMELRRILRKDGRLYLTIHDENTLEYLQANPDRDLARLLARIDPADRCWEKPFSMFVVNPGVGSTSSTIAHSFADTGVASSKCSPSRRALTGIKRRSY